MTVEEWVLAVTVFFSGLASGLLGMLCTITRPMLTEMDGRDRNDQSSELTAAVTVSGGPSRHR